MKTQLLTLLVPALIALPISANQQYKEPQLDICERPLVLFTSNDIFTPTLAKIKSQVEAKGHIVAEAADLKYQSKILPVGSFAFQVYPITFRFMPKPTKSSTKFPQLTQDWSRIPDEEIKDSPFVFNMSKFENMINHAMAMAERIRDGKLSAEEKELTLHDLLKDLDVAEETLIGKTVIATIAIAPRKVIAYQKEAPALGDGYGSKDENIQLGVEVSALDLKKKIDKTYLGQDSILLKKLGTIEKAQFEKLVYTAFHYLNSVTDTSFLSNEAKAQMAKQFVGVLPQCK